MEIFWRGYSKSPIIFGDMPDIPGILVNSRCWSQTHVSIKSTPPVMRPRASCVVHNSDRFHIN